MHPLEWDCLVGTDEAGCYPSWFHPFSFNPSISFTYFSHRYIRDRTDFIFSVISPNYQRARNYRSSRSIASIGDNWSIGHHAASVNQFEIKELKKATPSWVCPGMNPGACTLDAFSQDFIEDGGFFPEGRILINLFTLSNLAWAFFATNCCTN